eukprot:9689320-Alexandrium_andersonii.AAC.1
MRDGDRADSHPREVLRGEAGLPNGPDVTTGLRDGGTRTAARLLRRHINGAGPLEPSCGRGEL